MFPDFTSAELKTISKTPYDVIAVSFPGFSSRFFVRLHAVPVCTRLTFQHMFSHRSAYRYLAPAATSGSNFTAWLQPPAATSGPGNTYKHARAYTHMWNIHA